LFLLSPLSNAVCRRLQHHVELYNPTEQGILDILQRYCERVSCGPDLSLASAAATLHCIGACGAEVESFVRSAFMHALREQVQILKSQAGFAVQNDAAHAGSRGDMHPLPFVPDVAGGGVNYVLQSHFDAALADLTATRNGGDEGGVVASVEALAVDVTEEDKDLFPQNTSNSNSSTTKTFQWTGDVSFGV
jgi:SpoVK/Ycf46/Vps4 family AAA+-type ATPase